MKNEITRWVIGHKISPFQVSGDYDMVIGETPAKVPGPPPHFHNTFNELFLVIEGEMEFVVDGEKRLIRAGESIDLPPGVLHTFGNNSENLCKWVNIHSPKGFYNFFREVGIPETEENALAKSVEELTIQKVLKVAPDHDMHIRM